MEKNCMRVGSYVLLKYLGKGKHSKVYLGQDEQTEEQYAIKVMADLAADAEVVANFKSEVDALKKIRHPNIIGLHEFLPEVEFTSHSGATKKVSAIVLELAQNGRLFDYVSFTGELPEDIVRAYFHSLIEGLETIHKVGYCHRDLKPENLLLGNDSVLKIADFGLSTNKCGKDVMLTEMPSGTLGYAAPEVLRGVPHHGFPLDIFAAGKILFVMYSKSPPFRRADDEYYKLIEAKKPEIFWNIYTKGRPAGYFSADFKNLINRMLAFDPAERPTIEEIKKDPWYNGPLASFERIRDEMATRHLMFAKKTAEEQEEKATAAVKKTPERVLKTPLMFMAMPKAKGFGGSGMKLEDYEAEFPNLSDERPAIIYDDNQRKMAVWSDFFSASNELNTMISVLAALKEKKARSMELSSKKWKASATVMLEDQNEIELIVRLFKNDDNSTFVRFERRDGDVILFNDMVKDLQCEMKAK